MNGSVAVIVAKQNVFALIGTPDGGNNYADASGTSIKAKGSIGVTAEAEQLIDELLSLENPYHCPHGRPTIISMSKYEIEKKFKRIV